MTEEEEAKKKKKKLAQQKEEEEKEAQKKKQEEEEEAKRKQQDEEFINSIYQRILASTTAPTASTATPKSINVNWQKELIEFSTILSKYVQAREALIMNETTTTKDNNNNNNEEKAKEANEVVANELFENIDTVTLLNVAKLEGELQSNKHYYNFRMADSLSEQVNDLLQAITSSTSTSEEVSNDDTVVTVERLGKFFKDKDAEDRWALQLHQKCLDVLLMQQKEKGSDTDIDIDIANCYYNMGEILSNLEQMDESLTMHQKAFQIRKQQQQQQKPNETTSDDKAKKLNLDLAKSYIAIASKLVLTMNQEEDNKKLKEFKTMTNQALDILKEVYETENHSDIAELYNLIGLIYEEYEFYEDAMNYMNSALTIMEEMLGSSNSTNHPDVAVTYSNIATIYVAQEQYINALSMYEKVLLIRQSILRSDHNDIAETYIHIGQLFVSMGGGDDDNDDKYYEKAITMTKYGLDIQLRNSSVEEGNSKNQQLLVATTYNHLSSIYVLQGKWNDALTMMEKELSILETIYGSDGGDDGDGNTNDTKKNNSSVSHLSIATVLNEMAAILYRLEQHEKAKHIHERAISIIKNEFQNENHLDIATSYRTMATIIFDQCQGQQDKEEEVLRMYQIAINILKLQQKKKTKDSDGGDGTSSMVTLVSTASTTVDYSSEVADVYHSMGMVLSSQGKYNEAAELFEKELEIQKKLLLVVVGGSSGTGTTGGEGGTSTTPVTTTLQQYSDIADIYNTLATQYSNSGRNEEAYTTFKLALDYSKKANDHPKVGMAYNNLAAVLFTQEKYDEAITMHEKAITIRKSSLGKFHPFVAFSYRNMAEVLVKQGTDGSNDDKALEQYGKALGILKKTLGSDHPEVAAMYNHMAMILPGK